eukprot:TRINITY_DN112530_c0_g1_i1.p1 TRINITY_DN112530_c0_g1~~TRINITY_DN112530_c0_g1_i1.p1  ORF type:complete len:264 (+),score=61.17 TRINITY_DN112530_c0_g1_i1:54-794(+)
MGQSQPCCCVRAEGESAAVVVAPAENHPVDKEDSQKQDDVTSEASKEASRKRALANKKCGQAAKMLRKEIAKGKHRVWQKLEAEINVQKKIWGDMIIQKGEAYKDVTDKLTVDLDWAMANRERDPGTALNAVNYCILSKADFFTIPTREAFESVKEWTDVELSRTRLATLLEVASLASSRPSTEAQEQVPSLLQASKLEDAKLEKAIKGTWKLAVQGGKASNPEEEQLLLATSTTSDAVKQRISPS